MAKRKRRRNPKIEYKALSPYGKLTSNLAELIYDLAMDADEQVGSVDELGFYALILLKDDPLIVTERGKHEVYRAAIATEDSDGNFDYQLFEKVGDARKEWRRINSKYSRFYRGME